MSETVNCTTTEGCDGYPAECATCTDREPVNCLSWDSCSPYLDGGTGADGCLGCGHRMPDCAPPDDCGPA